MALPREKICRIQPTLRIASTGNDEISFRTQPGAWVVSHTERVSSYINLPSTVNFNRVFKLCYSFQKQMLSNVLES